ncbi:uncharacterized protein [Aegilops tauschii subsp. strangulata]|uniref:uncharacterized protein n=1 Tax=Aegilops tauschii subsp. strangulata TaxID=200361 RepID=UPI00098B724D|nr:histone H2A, sperm-like [Aegilops tauschii subsp. strangulata]
MSVEYGSMVELLGGESRHEVVNKGARLGKQLVELVQDEETGWHILASFWSELILYVAPSHNIKAHKKARANGNAAKDSKKTCIMTRHLLLATRNDEELSDLLDGITIAWSGVLPNIHSVLFSKKANMS